MAFLGLREMDSMAVSTFCATVNLLTLLNIRHLEKLGPEEGRLKYMTGEWFYEAKSKRHQDRIHGSDIIMASMKQKKPMTVGESLLLHKHFLNNRTCKDRCIHSLIMLQRITTLIQNNLKSSMKRREIQKLIKSGIIYEGQHKQMNRQG